MACLEDRTTLIGGLAAPVVGGLQVTEIVIKVLAPGDSLTPIHCLQLNLRGCQLSRDRAVRPLQVKSRSPIPRHNSYRNAEHGYFP